MTKQTTRLFDTWVALFDLLDGQSWPGEKPEVIFGDVVEAPDESIVVVGVPSDQPQIDWASYGAPSQDENFVLQVMVATRIPGKQRAEAFARLQQLIAVVEQALRDPTTGRPAGGFSSTVPGVLWWRIAQIRPSLLSSKEGSGGYAELDIAFRARI